MKFNSSQLPSREAQKKKNKQLKDDALQEIGEYIDENPDGPYTHNVLSFKLRALAESNNLETANEVVE